MENKKRLIDCEQAKRATYEEVFWTESEQEVVRNFLTKLPKVDAVEVVHGRWEKEGGDLHSSGYAVRCSVCNDVYFVHHKFSLGALTAEVLFKKPKYCPNCGAKMDGDGNG